MTKEQFLNSTAKLIWWQPKSEAIKDLPYLLRQVMTLGNYTECAAMLSLFSKRQLLQALKTAKAGQMTGRAWSFWHYYLTNCKIGELPPEPTRPGISLARSKLGWRN
ncbi:MAG: hypothetical protein IJS50_01965 [Desulfovibrio sp.]|nr:hypothetical protein [Desulfovibrio sp.]